MPEQSRTAASSDEHSLLLSVEEAADPVRGVWSCANHSRHPKALRPRGSRVSEGGDAYGERYLVTPASVDRHIAMIAERTAANGGERPRTDAPVHAPENLQPAVVDPAANVREQPRTDAYLEVLERENSFLRGQVGVKDEQIKDLTERARETNHLIGEMLTPFLGRGERGSRDDGAMSGGDNSS